MIIHSYYICNHAAIVTIWKLNTKISSISCESCGRKLNIEWIPKAYITLLLELYMYIILVLILTYFLIDSCKNLTLNEAAECW